MSVVHVTSDWHLGHKNVAKWRESFTDPTLPQEEHDTLVLSYYRDVVRPRDLVWFLGDIILHEDCLESVRDLPGTKKLVLGNHDTDRFAKNIAMSDLLEVFDEIHGMVSYKGTWLSHPPIHSDELRGMYNIHGHTHINVIQDDRYFNACLEYTNFMPMPFAAIKEILNSKNKKDI